MNGGTVTFISNDRCPATKSNKIILKQITAPTSFPNNKDPTNKLRQHRELYRIVH